MDIPATTRRVVEHAPDRYNAAIERQTRARIDYYAANPSLIDERLEELALTGSLLGLVKHRGFLILPIAVTGFLLQHAVQGWCPPMPVLRRLGFRTPREIEEERSALKAWRGDFEDIHSAREARLAAS